jgi:uncharacterized protein
MKSVLHVLRGIAGLAVFFIVVAAAQAAMDAVHVPRLAGLAVLAAVSLAVYAAWVRLVEQRAVTELAPRGAFGETAIGLCGGIALFAAVIGCITLAGGYHVRGTSSPAVLLAPMVTWFAVAISEELAFRGLLFRTIREAAGPWIALAVSALFFGLSHAANPGATLFSSFAIAIEAGVLLAIAYMVTDRLWLPIGIHAGWNFAEGTIFGTAVSGTTSAHPASVLHGVLSGPALVTGGAFGPEASLAAIIACVLASVALYRLGVKKPPVVEPSAA